MSKQSEWEKEIYKLIEYYNKYTQEFYLMLDEMGFIEHLIEKVREIIRQQRKELIEIVEQAHDKDFGTYDYKAIAEKVIELVKNESKKENTKK